MTIRIAAHDDVTVLAVVGAVDLVTAPLFENAINDAVAQSQSAGFVIDLSGVDFLASAGMAILVATQQRIAAATSNVTSFAVVADGPATSRPLALTGLDRVIAVRPTLPEALAACATSPVD